MRKPLGIQKCDRRTDLPTDLPTDTAKCRVACPRLEKVKAEGDRGTAKEAKERQSTRKGKRGGRRKVEILLNWRPFLSRDKKTESERDTSKNQRMPQAQGRSESTICAARRDV